MPTLLTNHAALCADDPPWSLDEAQVAAAAFLARYSGRTLEAYRHDLRYYFQWAADQQLAVLDASRAHIEIYRSTMEQRRLAASTIDRRLTTVCGYYRFAHIDGRIPANPAQYVRRPRVQPTEQHAMDRGELGRFLFAAENYDRAHAALAVLLGLNGLRVSEACATNIENLAFERGHRTLRIVGKGNNPPSFPWCRARHARSTSPSANATKAQSWCGATANGSIGEQRIAGCDRLANEADSATSIPTCCAPHSSWPPSTPASHCATFNSPPATPTRAPPRSTIDADRTSTATPHTSLSPSSPAADNVTSQHFGRAPDRRGGRDYGAGPACRSVPHFAGTVARTGAFASATIEWGPNARSPIGSAGTSGLLALHRPALLSRPGVAQAGRRLGPGLQQSCFSGAGSGLSAADHEDRVGSFEQVATSVLSERHRGQIPVYDRVTVAAAGSDVIDKSCSSEAVARIESFTTLIVRARTRCSALGPDAFEPLMVESGDSPELEEVVGGADQFPFAVDCSKAATGHGSDPSVVFDLGEDRFDSGGPLLVELLAARSVELGHHCGGERLGFTASADP